MGKYSIKVSDLSRNIYKTWTRSHGGPGRRVPYCTFSKSQLRGLVGSLMPPPHTHTQGEKIQEAGWTLPWASLPDCLEGLPMGSHEVVCVGQ